MQVYEGESEVQVESHLLGQFEFGGLQQLPKGQCRVNVTFEITLDGILRVSALELGTGLAKELTITMGRGRLPKAELERMTQKAQRLAKVRSIVTMVCPLGHALPPPPSPRCPCGVRAAGKVCECECEWGGGGEETGAGAEDRSLRRALDRHAIAPRCCAGVLHGLLPVRTKRELHTVPPGLQHHPQRVGRQVHYHGVPRVQGRHVQRSGVVPELHCLPRR
jgi:hypothetical protein